MAKKGADVHGEVVAVQDDRRRATVMMPTNFRVVVNNLLPYHDRSATRTHIPTQVARYLTRATGK